MPNFLETLVANPPYHSQIREAQVDWNNLLYNMGIRRGSSQVTPSPLPPPTPPPPMLPPPPPLGYPQAGPPSSSLAPFSLSTLGRNISGGMSNLRSNLDVAGPMPSLPTAPTTPPSPYQKWQGGMQGLLFGSGVKTPSPPPPSSPLPPPTPPPPPPSGGRPLIAGAPPPSPFAPPSSPGGFPQVTQPGAPPLFQGLAVNPQVTPQNYWGVNDRPAPRRRPAPSPRPEPAGKKMSIVEFLKSRYPKEESGGTFTSSSGKKTKVRQTDPEANLSKRLRWEITKRRLRGQAAKKKDREAAVRSRVMNKYTPDEEKYGRVPSWWRRVKKRLEMSAPKSEGRKYDVNDIALYGALAKAGARKKAGRAATSSRLDALLSGIKKETIKGKADVEGRKAVAASRQRGLRGRELIRRNTAITKQQMYNAANKPKMIAYLQKTRASISDQYRTKMTSYGGARWMKLSPQQKLAEAQQHADKEIKKMMERTI